MFVTVCFEPTAASSSRRAHILRFSYHFLSFSLLEATILNAQSGRAARHSSIARVANSRFISLMHDAQLIPRTMGVSHRMQAQNGAIPPWSLLSVTFYLSL